MKLSGSRIEIAYPTYYPPTIFMEKEEKQSEQNIPIKDTAHNQGHYIHWKYTI
jgi:hypothetical protein